MGGDGRILEARINQEQQDLEINSNKKARRWVVEVAHSWFNRFNEKLERSFGLN